MLFVAKGEEEACMVYVTGDTHTEWIKRLHMESFPEQKELPMQMFVRN